MVVSLGFSPVWVPIWFSSVTSPWSRPLICKMDIMAKMERMKGNRSCTRLVGIHGRQAPLPSPQGKPGTPPTESGVCLSARIPEGVWPPLPSPPLHYVSLDENRHHVCLLGTYCGSGSWLSSRCPMTPSPHEAHTPILFGALCPYLGTQYYSGFFFFFLQSPAWGSNPRP